MFKGLSVLDLSYIPSMTYIVHVARHEVPSGLVVKAPDKCTEGQRFDSHRELRCFLCPSFVTCWALDLSYVFLERFG